jgi:hypothetical protein
MDPRQLQNETSGGLALALPLGSFQDLSVIVV